MFLFIFITFEVSFYIYVEFNSKYKDADVNVNTCTRVFSYYILYLYVAAFDSLIHSFDARECNVFIPYSI